MFIFQNYVGKEQAAMRGIQEQKNASNLVFSRQPKIKDMKTVMPKLAEEVNYALSGANKLLYGLAQYENTRGAFASPDGKIYRLDGKDGLRAQFEALRQHVQSSGCFSGNPEFVGLLNKVAYGLDLLTPGTGPNKEYLAYLNPQAKEGGELSGVKASARKKITLEDDISQNNVTGGYTIVPNTRRDQIIWQVVVDIDALKTSALDAGLIGGQAMALQMLNKVKTPKERNDATKTLAEMEDAMAELHGGGFKSGSFDVLFPPLSPMGLVEGDIRTGNYAEAERKAKILVENNFYTTIENQRNLPQNAQLAAMTIKSYGLAPKEYEAGMTKTALNVGIGLAQSMPLTGTAWLGVNTYNAGKKAIKSGEGADYCKAGVWLAATIASGIADRYFFGKGGNALKYVAKNLGINIREDFAAWWGRPAAMAKEAELIGKVEGKFSANVAKAEDIAKEITVPGKEATTAKKLVGATEANVKSKELHDLAAGVNAKAAEKTELGTFTRVSPGKANVDVEAEVKRLIKASGANASVVDPRDLSSLNKVKPGNKVRVDINNNIYIVDIGARKVGVSRLGVKANEVAHIEKINQIAKEGDIAAMGAGEGLVTDGAISANAKKVQAKYLKGKYDRGVVDLNTNLNNAQNARTEISMLRQKNYDRLTEQLNLPKPEDVLKPASGLTPGQIWNIRAKSAQDKLKTITEDKNLYIETNPKDPVRKWIIGKPSYNVKYGITWARRYGAADAEFLVRKAGQIFMGTGDVSMITGLTAGHTLGRATGKYLLFGLDGVDVPSPKLVDRAAGAIFGGKQEKFEKGKTVYKIDLPIPAKLNKTGTAEIYVKFRDQGKTAFEGEVIVYRNGVKYGTPTTAGELDPVILPEGEAKWTIINKKNGKGLVKFQRIDRKDGKGFVTLE
ncbi:MAG: hypothetical protein NTX79_08850 [Candidatus Micrarchaeota archaeon]|nr:hypothetical protein [Candidatus Micrarchaeota archaeon]